jgi:solute carrier family 25 (mitochondrial phosphate transporter), member 3
VGEFYYFINHSSHLLRKYIKYLIFCFDSFYKGLTPLWARQVPYTMMKFASFERTVGMNQIILIYLFVSLSLPFTNIHYIIILLLEFIYTYLGRPKQDYNKLEQLGVSFLGGYIAGVFCAIVSHPADTLVSKVTLHYIYIYINKVH